MDTLISVHDLLLFVIFCVLLVICILVIRFLLNLNKLVKRINDFVIKNHNSISETLDTLPKTIKNVNEMSVSIKAVADKTGVAVDSIEATFTDTLDSVGQGTGGFISFVSSIGNVIKVVSSFFSKKSD